VHGALGAIGPLVHPDPRKVLIIGMATGGSAYAAGVNPLTERIRVIEIIAPVYRVMRSFAAGKTDGLGTAVIRQLLADTRYEFLIGDARHFLAVDPERYDIIQSDAIYPFWSRAGMLYSVEFFRAARDHLTESGLFVQWGPTERTVASFLSVFPYVLKVGAAPVLIGSLRPIPLSAAKIAMLLTGSAGAYLEGGGYDPRKILDVLIHPAERGWTPADPRVAADVNTDLFPKDEFFANR
jgi:hypothetical protein